ncbi:MAG: class II glutamine amidotransferase [Clostridiales bacterium]|nr:class II glutamine amidotransferase [Clostridiales bacterium]
MCELLGITSREKLYANDLLREFFGHSDLQPDGWGLAILDSAGKEIHKEPIEASRSRKLKELLENRICTGRAIAHIRKATIGSIDDYNTHPFSGKDITGRIWTLVHNGTVFEAEQLHKYVYYQQGSTDSERILLYIIDKVNRYINLDSDLSDINIRASLIEKLILDIVPRNKLNLLIDDGEYLYAHKNEAGTLFFCEENATTILSTKPLNNGTWKELPENRLFVYKDGSIIYEGVRHEHSYAHDDERMKTLYMEYAAL